MSKGVLIATEDTLDTFCVAMSITSISE